MVKCIRAVLTGKVQGVFFRDFVKQNANKLKIMGYVKNLRNGGLEFVAQGSDRNVDALVKLCRKGPIFAKVSGVEIEDFIIEEGEEYEFFDIRYS